MDAFRCLILRLSVVATLAAGLCLAGLVGPAGLSAPALADDGLSLAAQSPSLALTLSEAPRSDVSEAVLALNISQGEALSRTCCKICRRGKACGNSCINKAYTCHRPAGCACDGN